MTSIEWTSAEHDEAELGRLADETGLAETVATGERLVIDVVTAPGPTYDRVHRRLSDEHFRIDLVPGDVCRVTIEASSRRGLRWAMVDLAGRRRNGESPDDSWNGPAFGIRGVIEGFYGQPWSEDQRLDMIEFLAAHRFNTFLYAPKDDPFLRDRWREAHGAGDLRRLRATIDRCHDVDLTAMVGVSPGLSMQYSSVDDRSRLDAKVLDLVDAGVDHVALLFDDIPPSLQHPADLDAFRSLAEAHADVSNHVAEVLRERGRSRSSCARPCTTARATRSTSSPSAHCSTGASTCSGPGGRSARRRSRPAEAVDLRTGRLRPPLYWDNYPVNDVAMIHEAHLGPYRRRDPLLDRFSRRDDGQRHGARRGVEDRPGDDRRLSLGAGCVRPRAQLGSAPSPKSAVRMRGRCSASPTRSAAAAWPSRTRRAGTRARALRLRLAHGDGAAARAQPRRDRCPARPRRGDAAVAGRLQPAARRRAAAVARQVRRRCRRRGRAGPRHGRADGEPQRPPSCARLADELRGRPHVVFGSLLEMAIDRALRTTTSQRKEQP